MRFDGRTVLVTGGSRGIGRSVAVAFAERGASVAVHYNRDADAAQATLEALRAGSHLSVRADMADPGQVRDMVDAVAHRLGRLDVLVNNAGIFEEHRILEVSYEEWQEAWRRTLEVNLLGVANACWCASRQMARQGRGRIVNVSSRGAFRGEPNHPAYGASKAGLNSLGQSLAVALAGAGITVTTVAPGFVATDMVASLLDGPAAAAIRGQSPLGRVARPEEVAAAVLFLASDEAEFATGAILDLNGASYLRT